MYFGLVTGLLFAVIFVYMGNVECSIKTAEADISLVSASEEFMSGPGRSQKLTRIRRNTLLQILDVLSYLKNPFIYPGTKWCGPGNKAKNENDYGTSVQTDKCCQEHDGCKTYIAGYGYDYGLRNYAPYTVSGCDCDENFLNCMLDVKTSSTAPGDDKTTANKFGNLFFNYISPRCLKQVYQFTCTSHGFFGNCLAGFKDRTKDKVWELVNGPSFPYS